MADDFAPSELDAAEDDAYTVRPYAVTGGRVGDADDLPLEALIETLDHGKPLTGMTPEKKKILQFAADDYISVAEASAHCKLPLGVTRVLITELVEQGFLAVHHNAPAREGEKSLEGGITLSLLESVLDGIAAL